MLERVHGLTDKLLLISLIIKEFSSSHKVYYYRAFPRNRRSMMVDCIRVYFLSSYSWAIINYVMDSKKNDQIAIYKPKDTIKCRGIP